MALPDSIKLALGTAVVWGTPSGSGVTKDLTMNNIASGSGRMGVYADLGALWEEEYYVLFAVETGTAPTAGNIAELYFACSHSSSFFPGKVTGSDAAYPTTVADNKKQLGSPVVILAATADGNTLLYQQPVIWRPAGRYVAPVFINSMGQSTRNQATAADNLGRVYLVPRLLTIED